MRSALELGRMLRGDFSKILSGAGSFSIDELRKEDGLKDSILSDVFFSKEITTGGSFKVRAPRKMICRSLLRDYLFGWDRVLNQWTLVRELAENGRQAEGNNTAWALVSAYYCAFFGALDILRICGFHQLTLMPEEVKLITDPVQGAFARELATKRNFIGTLSQNLEEIGYTTTGEKPHKMAWVKFKEHILQRLPKENRAYTDISKFSAICVGKNRWENPSSIRNRWNYHDPMYFGLKGKEMSSPFLRLLLDSKQADNWIRGISEAKQEKDLVASVAALAQLIFVALKETYEYGLLTHENLEPSG